MNDIKTDFRKWLQKNFSKSTAYNYYALVQKIFAKNFGNNKDWQQYSENIIPLLVRYILCPAGMLKELFVGRNS